jgi:hypothetical protein
VVLALTLAYRGRVGEAYRVWEGKPGGPPRARGWLNPFIDLALMGTVPTDTIAAVLRRPLERGEFWPPRFGQGVALPWWAVKQDTVSLTRFARRADSAAHVGGSPVARSYVAYLGDAARAYLALARRDSATALQRLVALPDSSCLVNDCFFEKLTQARLYAIRGQDREAARLLDQWLHTRDISPLFILGTLERGRIAERLGDPARAVKAYHFVANVWRHADSELQTYVDEAREGLTRLTAEATRRPQ